MIIVLLLVILGVLLKNHNKSRLEENLAETFQAEAIQVEEIDNIGEEYGPAEKAELEIVNPQIESVSVNTIVSEDKFLEGKNIVVFGDSIWDDARGDRKSVV